MKYGLCLVSVLAVFSSLNARASFTFGQQIDAEGLRGITEFIGTLTYLPELRGPGTSGKDWGFDVGAAASLSDTNELQQALATTTGSSIPDGQFPYGYLLLRTTLPWSLSLDLAWLPEIDKNGFYFKSTASALRWSFGDYLKLPFSADVRMQGSQIAVSYLATTVTVPPVTARISAKVKQASLTTSIGKRWGSRWFAAEPYVGGGLAYSQGTFAASAAQSDFFNVSAEDLTPKMYKGVFYVGLETRLSVLKLAFEYDRFGSINRLNLSVTLGADW